MKVEQSGVACQYAQAFLELAEKEGSGAEQKVLTEIEMVSQVLSENQDLALVLSHPSVGPLEKKELLVRLFKAKVSDLTMRLLELLNDKRRLEIVPALVEQYKELLRQKQNIAVASLTCSEQLSQDAIANIKARLTEHLGKKLELEVKVDPSLLGGVVLRLGDQEIDGSLRGRLKAIERTLLSV